MVLNVFRHRSSNILLLLNILLLYVVLFKNVECLNIFNPPSTLGFIEFKRFAHCNDVGTDEINYDMHLTRKSRRDVMLYGNITYKIAFDKDVSLHVVVDAWGNGGWRKNYFIIQKENACKAFEELLGVCWHAFKNSACRPITPSCPIPVGHFICKEVNTIIFNNCSLPLIIGRFRIHHAFYKNNIRRGCYESIVEVNERNDRTKS